MREHPLPVLRLGQLWLLSFRAPNSPGDWFKLVGVSSPWYSDDTFALTQ